MSDHFLKWYPENAMTSPRWRRLTLEQKGLFHELYDFAATCDPRGTLSANGLPMTGAELAHYFGLDEDRFNALFLPMIHPSLSLIRQSSKKRFMFPDWPRHQRNAPFRTRHAGAEVAQEWREIGATDIERDVEGDQEEDKEREKTKPATLRFDKQSRCFVGITENDMAAWKEAYPAVAVKIELRRMAEWLLANPTKAVKRNWRRFITNWLSRTQNGGGSSGVPNEKGENGGKPSGRRYRASQKLEA